MYMAIGTPHSLALGCLALPSSSPKSPVLGPSPNTRIVNSLRSSASWSGSVIRPWGAVVGPRDLLGEYGGWWDGLVGIAKPFRRTEKPYRTCCRAPRASALRRSSRAATRQRRTGGDKCADHEVDSTIYVLHYCSGDVLHCVNYQPIEPIHRVEYPKKRKPEKLKLKNNSYAAVLLMMEYVGITHGALPNGTYLPERPSGFNYFLALVSNEIEILPKPKPKPLKTI